MTGHAAAGPDSPIPSSPRSHFTLITATLVAACWWIFLVWLAIFTANPVTLNREQILRASYVVTGTLVSNPPTAEVAIEREWKDHGLSGTILVNDLPAIARRPGLTYIIPLSRVGHGFHVTQMPPPNKVPLIYPATSDSIGQLQAILGTELDHE